MQFMGNLYNTQSQGTSYWVPIPITQYNNGKWSYTSGPEGELVEHNSDPNYKTFEFYIVAKDQNNNDIFYNNGGQNYKIYFNTGTTNEIGNIKLTSVEVPFYNLSGQPIRKDYKGIVISNNRKILFNR